MLATCSQEKLDKLSHDNEEFFKYRFGFSATKVVREQVLSFKAKYSLLDSELRQLKKTGFLQITRTKIKVSAPQSTRWIGWLQLAILVTMCTGMCFQIAYSNAPAWGQALGELLLVISACIGITHTYKSYIAPWKILSESGAINLGKS